MNEPNDGGPAFPSLRVEDCNGRETRAQIDRTEGTLGGFLVNHPGATLRDYFAVHATDRDVQMAAQVFMAVHEALACSNATARYFHADAMLKARGTPR